MLRQWWVLTILCLVAGWLLVMMRFRFSTPRTANLGMREDRLAPCPQKPNCVCTYDTDPDHHLPPLTFTGSPAEAMTRLKTVLDRYPRVTIVSEDDRYLHAEFRSLLFRFVDDVEFLIDGPAQVIHFRSASQVGRSDLGVNRRRMEAIRREFTATVD